MFGLVFWAGFAGRGVLGWVCLLGNTKSDLLGRFIVSYMLGFICLVGSAGFIFLGSVFLCWV